MVDGVSGIWLQTYFWTALGILGVGLVAGLLTRRTPLSLLPLLVLAAAGSVAFAGSHARLHDGAGKRLWIPTAAPGAGYRLAFGEGVLDLRSLPAQDVPRRIDVTIGAGQVLVIAPKSLPLTVQANVHLGQIELREDGRRVDSQRVGGAGVARTLTAPGTASGGQPLLVDIHLADGTVTLDRRG